jgi:predicted DCC family thiol-disulfide oxidoreductase YuxK
MSRKPLLIFDAECSFCEIWIEYWKFLTGDSVEYASSQEANIKSVQLALPDGEVLVGARAVFSTIMYAPGFGWVRWLYDHIPGFGVIAEALYRFIATHRTLFYHVTRLTVGRTVRPLRYGRVEWLFLRALALIYFVAFGSLGLQIVGLIGELGIEPLGRYLRAISQSVGVRGYWMSPGIFWLAHSDAFLRGVCITGMVLSILLLFGYFERAALVSLYVLYLSLCCAGQDFLSFQWDMLLLETGFLAIFLGSSKVIILLFRWLLFRLMFLSGAVKLLSHDKTWRDLSALDFHYWTQPLPTPIAWYMNQLPASFQHFSTGAILLTELAVPFLIFGPRRWRFFGAGCLLGLQTMIFLTGNYTFFNLLTMALCLFLFDDAALGGLRLRTRAVKVKPAVAMCVAVLLGGLSAFELWGVFTGTEPIAPVRLAAPFGIVNTYGLFAVMTTTRPEIIVQGSNDGVTWLDYGFKYKAGDLRRAPQWVAPYQPRLDWQMWFAALEGREPAWFDNFMVRLLQGSPDVLGLLAGNPFPSSPPKYVRALSFNYSFTDFQTRRATGNWWQRTPRGRYFPEISLADVRLH